MNSLEKHYKPNNFSDKIALSFTKFLRFLADTFFKKRYGHRAVVLETVAAVPGMVAGMIIHLRSLRKMQDDKGWIKILLDEAANERMHLMTFIKIAKPTFVERLIIMIAQFIFILMYLFIYLISQKTAHRIVGYFEEEAVISYSEYLKEIEEGKKGQFEIFRSGELFLSKEDMDRFPTPKDIDEMVDQLDPYSG